MFDRFIVILEKAQFGHIEMSPILTLFSSTFARQIPYRFRTRLIYFAGQSFPFEMNKIYLYVKFHA